MNSRGTPADPHKCGIKVARAVETWAHAARTRAAAGHGSEVASTCQPWTRAVQSGTATRPTHASVIAARITIPAEMATGCRLWPLFRFRRDRRPTEFAIVTASRVP